MVDDIPYLGEASPACRVTFQHFNDSLTGLLIRQHAPHNSDVRLPQENTTEWLADAILNHLYAATAMRTWSPKSFRRYVRKQVRKVYYNSGDDENSGNGDNDGDDDDDNARSGPSDVSSQMGSQTGHSGGRRNLRKKNKTRYFPKRKGRVADLMDGVFALWKQSSKVAKPKPEDARASTLTRNEDIKVWLESVEGAVEKDQGQENGT